MAPSSLPHADDHSRTSTSTDGGPSKPAIDPNTNAALPPPAAAAAPGQPENSMIAFDIKYEIDATSAPLLFRQAPWRLLWRDTKFVLNSPTKWLNIARPTGIKTQTPTEPLSSRLGAYAMVLGSLVVSIPLFLAPPLLGIPALGLYAKACFSAQGEFEFESHGEADPKFDNERWFYVNGINTSKASAQIAANRFHELFGRKIYGIHNKTLGMLFDVGECILQRDLLLSTTDVRGGYKKIRKAIADEKIERVIILGHSQGGIICTAWADQLLTDFPHDMLHKVEFYTFASAANHFSNPVLPSVDQSPPTADSPHPFTKGAKRPFRHVEHFANELDPVAMLGVVGSAIQVGGDKSAASISLSQRDINLQRVEALKSPTSVRERIPTYMGGFGGRVFTRLNRPGHNLLKHYLQDETVPGQSILEHPLVKRYSRLTQYLGGGIATCGGDVCDCKP